RGSPRQVPGRRPTFLLSDCPTNLKISGGHQRPTPAARPLRSRRSAPREPEPQGQAKDAPRSEANKYRGVRGEGVLTSRFLQVPPKIMHHCKFGWHACRPTSTTLHWVAWARDSVP